MSYTNGEIRPIQAQGKTLNLDGLLIYGPEKGNYASISALNFNGSGKACSFKLYRFTSLTGKKIRLYTAELAAGETLIDTVGYHLAGSMGTPGEDYFWLSPLSGKISYSIEGLEYEHQTIQPPFGRSGTISVIDKYGQIKTKCCGSDGSGYEYDCIDYTITAETQTFQDDKLIGATDLKFIFVDKQVFTEINGDFSFNSTTGTITLITIIMYVDSTIVIPFNRKL